MQAKDKYIRKGNKIGWTFECLALNFAGFDWDSLRVFHEEFFSHYSFHEEYNLLEGVGSQDRGGWQVPKSAHLISKLDTAGLTAQLSSRLETVGALILQVWVQWQGNKHMSWFTGNWARDILFSLVDGQPFYSIKGLTWLDRLTTLRRSYALLSLLIWIPIVSLNTFIDTTRVW